LRGVLLSRARACVSLGVNPFCAACAAQAARLIPCYLTERQKWRYHDEERDRSSARDVKMEREGEAVICSLQHIGLVLNLSHPLFLPGLAPALVCMVVC
jgi:hypothetical protein